MIEGRRILALKAAAWRWSQSSRRAVDAETLADATGDLLMERDRLHDAVELLLINHHHELLKPVGEQDPEIAELAAVYQQLTGWDALEEIAHHEAHVRMGEAFKDAATWTEEGT